MKVFAVFSERKAGLIKIWGQSWEARGWSPRLIAPSEVRQHGSARAAAHKRGGGFLTDLQVINFAFPVRNRRSHRVIRYMSPGWKEAGLVRFGPDDTDQVVTNCGRPIWG